VRAEADHFIRRAHVLLTDGLAVRLTALEQPHGLEEVKTVPLCEERLF
jgi:hypothetical protein